MGTEAVTILSGRFTVPAGQKQSSNFWVSKGFQSIKGMVNISAVGPGTRVRLIQSVDAQQFDRDRKIPIFEAGLDVEIVEPVVSVLARVDVENAAPTPAEVAVDIQLRKERIESGDLRFRDFFHETIVIAAGGDFPANAVNVQVALGRPVLNLKLTPSAAGLLVKVNDITSLEFSIPLPALQFTPEVDQLEICQLFFKNPTGGAITVEIYGA